MRERSTVNAFAQSISEVVVYLEKAADDGTNHLGLEQFATHSSKVRSQRALIMTLQMRTLPNPRIGSIRPFWFDSCPQLAVPQPRIAPSLTTANFNGCIAFPLFPIVPTRPLNAHHRRRNRLRRSGRRRLSRGDRQ